jgi:hypothetical protein
VLQLPLSLFRLEVALQLVVHVQARQILLFLLRIHLLSVPIQA